MGIIVQKFGGTSVADSEKIRRAAERVISAVKNGFQVVVVASARGKQTDQLIADALEVNPNPPKRELDQLLSTGEQQTVSLFAMALDAMGYDAISFTGGQIRMLTDGVYTQARIKSVDADRIHKQLDAGKIVIVAGFQGIDEKENITTLGRGGSDTTAVALAAALKAEECEIYTDVDGIHTTDPRIFKDAAKIEQISYDEMLELSSLGAGVIYTRAVECGKKYNVKIHVRSSSEEKEGTMITHEVPQMEGVVVSGATVQKNMAKIDLVGVESGLIINPATPPKYFPILQRQKLSSATLCRLKSAPIRRTCHSQLVHQT
jgi:aspartate kinase